MIGVDEVGLLPLQRGDGSIGFGAHIRRQRPDNAMLAVRFVPDRRNVDAFGLRHLHGLKLRDTLTTEPVADSHRKSRQFHHFQTFRIDLRVI